MIPNSRDDDFPQLVWGHVARLFVYVGRWQRSQNTAKSSRYLSLKMVIVLLIDLAEVGHGKIAHRIQPHPVCL